MRLRRVIARLVGTLYLLLGGANLIGLMVPEIREQSISLGAVLFRYSGFVVVGIGLLLLRKWSAYVLALILGANFLLVYTVYGGQTKELVGYMALLPFIGPILTVVLFHYLWPVLNPKLSGGATDDV